MPRTRKPLSPEARDWQSRAAEMLSDAERMAPGPERTEALRKARELV